MLRSALMCVHVTHSGASISLGERAFSIIAAADVSIAQFCPNNQSITDFRHTNVKIRVYRFLTF